MSNHRTKKTCALMCGIAAMTVALFAGGASAQEATLRLHNFNSPKAIANRLFLKPWAKELAKETNGALKVQVYPSMQLGGRPADLYGQARDGVVDIIWTLPGYSAGRFPLTEVFELPFVGGNAIATSLAMNEFYEKWWKDEYKDTHPLVFHATARAHIHTAKRPVRRMEDLAGMKLRAPSRATADMLRALGAVPVGMPVPKVYEAISRGVVEGTWITWTIMRPFRLHEVTRYHTEVYLAPALFVMTMNKQSYARLSAKLRKAIDDSTDMRLARKLGVMWHEDEKLGRAIAVKRKHTMISLPAAEMARWRQKTDAVVQAWIKKVNAMGHDGRAMVADARRLVAKYSQ